MNPRDQLATGADLDRPYATLLAYANKRNINHAVNVIVKQDLKVMFEIV